MRRRNNNDGGQRHHSGGGGQHRQRRYSKPYGGGSHSNSSSGPEDQANVSRVRRNALANREKFTNMARDAMSSGDRVMSEYYLQHAEHYFRVIAALPPEQVRQPQHNNGHDGQQNTQAPQPADSGNQNPPPDRFDDRQEERTPTGVAALPPFITGTRDE